MHCIVTPFDSLKLFDREIIILIDSYMPFYRCLSRTHTHWFVHYGLSDDLCRAFTCAVREGELSSMMYIIEQAKDDFQKHNMIVQNDNENICVACTRGHLNIVKYLVSKGLDITTRYNICLTNACANGHLEVVKYLLTQVNDLHLFADRAIIQACRNGHLNIVKFLMSLGSRDCGKAVFVAATNGQFEVFKYLTSISEDARVEIRKKSNNIIAVASARGHTKVVNYITSRFIYS